MKQKTANVLGFTKPITVGLTCWLWEWSRARTIIELARSMNVSLQLKQHVHGLHREIQCEVSGDNVDQFIGEFMRRC